MCVRLLHLEIINGNIIWQHGDKEGYIAVATTSSQHTTEPHIITVRALRRSSGGSMHRSYQPLKPATNRYLQRRWDQNNYENHRTKVGGGRGRSCGTATGVTGEVTHHTRNDRKGQPSRSLMPLACVHLSR